MGLLERIRGIMDKNEVGTGDSEETEDDDAFEELGSGSREFNPDDITIRFRAKPGGDAVDCQHDFTHIPSEDEIADTFGPGYFTVYVRTEKGKRPVPKGRFTIEGNPTLQVDHYELKIRLKKGGKLHDKDISLPGPTPPIKEEIINELDGGGFVKVNAVGEDGKQLWSEWRDYHDIDPPSDLLRAEEGFEGKLSQAVEDQKKKSEEEVLSRLVDAKKTDEKKNTKFEDALDRIISVVEDKKMEHFEDALSGFVNRLNTPTDGSGSAGESKAGISDLVFKAPYQMKLEAQRQIISELAKQDPEKALKMLDKMPDGISTILNLTIAGTGLLGAITESFVEDTDDKKKDKRKNRRATKEDKKGENKVEEPDKEDVNVKSEEKLDIKEEDTEAGYKMQFGVREEDLVEKNE